MNSTFIQKYTFFILFFMSLMLSAKIEITTQHINDQTFKYTFTMPVKQGHGIYQDSISLSVNDPNLQLSDWKASIEPIMRYDTYFKTSKNIYMQPFSITATLHSPISFPDHASLFLTFYQQGIDKIQHYQFDLHFNTQQSTPLSQAPLVNEETSTPLSSAQKLGWSACIQGMIQSSDSMVLRIVLALFLGLLLSLTPCIYPMIPITMGILQSQHSRSMSRSFLLALIYTLGIATTFALLGVAAAFTGKMFGSFMSNPIVICIIVALMIYLAGSMIGWYDLYIPRFLQPKDNQLQGNSLASIFLFGAVSGTVASPCLSPGLLLLLTIVTTLESYVLGFLLLFAFGFGLGIPLLIIGTFSSSLNVLPRAGMWMIHVKRFFGFIMLGTCLYFIQCLINEWVLAWLVACYIFTTGVFYFYYAQKEMGASRIIQNIIGTLLVAGSVYACFHAFKLTAQANDHTSSLWLYDYQQALQQAHNEHKKIILDISAPYCSICKAIDKKIFADKAVITTLEKFIPVKIEDIEADEITLALKDKFKVVGAPTIVLYDPENDTELARWGSELYDTPIETFIQELNHV